MSIDCKPPSTMPDAARLARIAGLNDELRRAGRGGRCVATPGVLALPHSTKLKLFLRLISYDAFGPDSDPYGEHDFGAFEVGSHEVFFKIEAYDRELLHASPDPSDRLSRCECSRSCWPRSTDHGPPDAAPERSPSAHVRNVREEGPRQGRRGEPPKSDPNI